MASLCSGLNLRDDRAGQKDVQKHGWQEDPLLGMVEKMLSEMPLRSMLMMSNGAIKKAYVGGIIANDQRPWFQRILGADKIPYNQK